MILSASSCELCCHPAASCYKHTLFTPQMFAFTFSNWEERYGILSHELTGHDRLLMMRDVNQDRATKNTVLYNLWRVLWWFPNGRLSLFLFYQNLHLLIAPFEIFETVQQISQVSHFSSFYGFIFTFISDVKMLELKWTEWFMASPCRQKVGCCIFHVINSSYERDRKHWSNKSFYSTHKWAPLLSVWNLPHVTIIQTSLLDTTLTHYYNSHTQLIQHG